MKTFKIKIQYSRYLLLVLLYFLAICLIGCKSDKSKDSIKEESFKETSSTIEIVTNNMEFKTVDTLTSGWHTFKYQNMSNETHFFLMDKYPEGKTIVDTKNEVSHVFDKGMDLINQGNAEAGFAEFNKLPAWFFEVVFSGGSGLISPKHTSETTIELQPGYYVMECYVKMPNGKFHGSMGMAKAIFVSSENSGNKPPVATLDLTISSTEGIQYEGVVSKGEQVFSVTFKDQIVHENFVGHDVNLVKLEDNANLETLENWMNWADPKGLTTPAPDGVTFMGGVNDSPTGSVGYFKVSLEPGNYAFISEVPFVSKKGMFKTFTVSP